MVKKANQLLSSRAGELKFESDTKIHAFNHSDIAYVCGCQGLRPNVLTSQIRPQEHLPGSCHSSEMEWPLLPDTKSQDDRGRQIPVFRVCQVLPSYQRKQAEFHQGRGHLKHPPDQYLESESRGIPWRPSG